MPPSDIMDDLDDDDDEDLGTFYGKVTTFNPSKDLANLVTLVKLSVIPNQDQDQDLRFLIP